jgi:hypothetical protein
VGYGVAKVDRPLLSESAYGTIVKRVQFRRYWGGVHGDDGQALETDDGQQLVV